MTGRKLAETDYIIGANDAEIARLGVQHAIWRETVTGAWRRAGLKPGMTVLDMGCGPGHASLDLAELVGPGGKVIAVDQSPLFLDALRASAARRGVTNIETVETDLARLALPAESVDFAWSRWVLSFTPDPDDIVARAAAALRPGGVFLAFEYGDYDTFAIHPMSEAMTRFIAAVVESWRAFGGAPDLAMHLPGWFRAAGLENAAFAPHVFAARPGDLVWRWPWEWLKGGGVQRLVDLGFLAAADAERVHAFLDARAADPDSLLLTPMVVEALARKPDRPARS